MQRSLEVQIWKKQFWILKWLQLERGENDVQVMEEDVQDFAKERLPKYQAPHKVVVLEEIPRNPMGKINKKALKEELKL